MTDQAKVQVEDDIDCPRCAELRGRVVKMGTVKIGQPSRVIKPAYECPSCEYVITLAQFDLAAEIVRLRAQLSVVMEEKQKQVNYWGDRCCKAEAQRDELTEELSNLSQRLGSKNLQLLAQRDQLRTVLKQLFDFCAGVNDIRPDSRLMRKARAAIAAVEKKP